MAISGYKTCVLYSRIVRKGTNGVSTDGVTANLMFLLTEGLLGYSR